MLKVIFLFLVIFGGLEARVYRFRGLKMQVPDTFVVSQSSVTMRGKSKKAQFSVDVRRNLPQRRLFDHATHSSRGLTNLEKELAIGEIESCQLVDALGEISYRLAMPAEKRISYFIPVRGERMVEVTFVYIGSRKEVKAVAEEVVNSMKYIKPCRCIPG